MPQNLLPLEGNIPFDRSLPTQPFPFTYRKLFPIARLGQVRQGSWAVWEQGIYFVNRAARPQPSIEFYNLATEHTTRVATIEKGLFGTVPSLTTTADGRWILYAQLD